MNIEPQRALVTPRVRSDGNSRLPLECELLPLLQEHSRGAIALLGGMGSGKTTALRHLKCLLPEESNIELLDDESEARIVDRLSQSGLVVYTAQRAFDLKHRAIFRLTNWTRDDWIEYLLAAHREQCASVMTRVQTAEGAAFIAGNPELWRVILDTFAAHEHVSRLGDALLCFLRLNLTREQLAQAQRACLTKLLMDPKVLRRTAVCFPKDHCVETVGLDRNDFAAVSKFDCDERARRLFRHEQVQLVLAREHIVGDLKAKQPCKYLVFRIERTLLRMLGSALKHEPAALHYLEKLSGERELQAMAASLLHGSEARWIPSTRQCNWSFTRTRGEFSGGYFDFAQWPKAELSSARFDFVTLTHGNLKAADLCNCDLIGADFSFTTLQQAQLKDVRAENSVFRGADFSSADLSRANFKESDLSGACFEQAAMQGAVLTRANLTGARFFRARLFNALLTGAQIDGADFSQADLSSAVLQSLVLRTATFTGASFRHADLRGCDLENMELPSADFRKANLSGAYLTGSFIPKGNFAGANLSCTGLAGIEWERADLSGADLRGCSFHLGSTRSGRVDSFIACEGSRTGFYTDEYQEQHFKAPEQSKANLRGADLRGANIDNVDFYLVDLRDARYDARQEEHFRRCRAILESRV
ncbi:MAG TPA: pentapeptide repeat-containing protein [Planctomycetota bacterium]|nr:pentapeptide repeat-containing protein [Planctomycetota bacterium]